MALAPAAAIFRRFGFLNSMNLLRLQAELHNLEDSLKDACQEDQESGDPIRAALSHDFWLMRENIDNPNFSQHELLVEIGDKLKEYNESIKTLMCIADAARPSKTDIEFLQLWLLRDTMGNNFLTGIESMIWSQENHSDLISILPRSREEDCLTEFLRGKLLSAYHLLVGRHLKTPSKVVHENVRLYHEKSLDAASGAIVAAFSAILPTVMVLALYFVKSMEVRIGLVILFTTIFSVTLALFTGAKKVEIFSATAAFAAVEVVFIGSVSGLDK